MREETRKNNVISIYRRQRFQFLQSDFYSHNRKESLEEKAPSTTGSIIFVMPLVIAALTFGLFSFITTGVASSLLIGTLIGYFVLSKHPYKVEDYFENLLPEIVTEYDFQMKKVA
jgi:hypothetical protein